MAIYSATVVPEGPRPDSPLCDCIDGYAAADRGDWEGRGTIISGLLERIQLVVEFHGFASAAQDEAVQRSEGVAAHQSESGMGGGILSQAVLPGLLLRVGNQSVSLDAARI